MVGNINERYLNLAIKAAEKCDLELAFAALVTFADDSHDIRESGTREEKEKLRDVSTSTLTQVVKTLEESCSCKKGKLPEEKVLEIFGFRMGKT